MLYDKINIQDFVDSEAALEFMKEATKLASSSDLADIGMRLEKKAQLFSELLAEDQIHDLSVDEFKLLTDSIFSIKRKAHRILKHIGIDAFKASLAELLYGEAGLDIRFNKMSRSLEMLDESMRFNFISELMHFSNPQKYWLWTNWIWDSKKNTGALSLVLNENIDLEAETPGALYLKIGKASALVNTMGHSIGFSGSAAGLFGTDVFFACVYAVYMYTVFRVKLSQEFNRILPELTELTQRILGVHKMVNHNAGVLNG